MDYYDSSIARTIFVTQTAAAYGNFPTLATNNLTHQFIFNSVYNTVTFFSIVLHYQSLNEWTITLSSNLLNSASSIITNLYPAIGRNMIGCTIVNVTIDMSSPSFNTKYLGFNLGASPVLKSLFLLNYRLI